MLHSDHQIFHANDVIALKAIAEAFLRKFPDGGIFLLMGDMGAGKTTFIKEVCALKGVEIAGSPTYSIVNEYRNTAGIAVYHFDLYRVKTMAEALDFGFDEYLDRHGYIFIEWPQVVMEMLPAGAHTLSITDNGGIRKIEF